MERFRPWRSARLGYTIAAAALVGGVPLFLAMPPWADVTLYDMAARAVLRGGVYYRDVFDTNLPGMGWATAAVRGVFGWSYPTLRAFDLLVIGLQVFVLCRWAKAAGGSAASVAWMVAAACLFYPFTSEFSHVQRDPWMALPAVVAAWMRVRALRQTAEEPNPPTPLPSEGRGALLPSPLRGGAGGGVFASVLEGFVWGLAVWVKPHIVVPAFAVWVVSAVLLKRAGRSVRRDLLGLLAGGLLAGLPGVAVLVGTGAWPYFVDVFRNWNPDYLADVWKTLPQRVSIVFDCFRPWSLLHLAAIPLAVASLANLKDAARSVLAALYLGFLLQGVLLQKGFDYVHVSETFLGMAVLAARGWAVGFGYVVWFLAAAGLLTLAERVPATAPVVRALNPNQPGIKFERHTLLDWTYMRHWRRCLAPAGHEMELRDRLGHYTDVHCGTTWEDLDRVAAFLRTIDPPVGDRELTCWHDSTHPLYLMLNVEPSTRYMHFGTAFAISPYAAGRIADDVRASPQRYAVSDLRRMAWEKAKAWEPGAGGDPLRLPTWFPVSQRGKFPWNQPIVFRSGRYLVHRVSEPLGEVGVPDWFSLDKLGPGE